ncbi:cytochrome P450 [Corynebacterium hylobatis]|uniref:Cytochrome P450 n=1 Tax=Corynebacterium hylobatis TaxID=1859290 RepID=A0A3S0B3H8_9CORY|nr:cytochrome P450 [Corynebacterium hylobatis]RSZ61909.1 cytochrome P450 [Corynebacterium hylobatis]
MTTAALNTTAMEAPVADWVTIPELYHDPYPIYRRLREEAPVHWVPAINRYLVVSYDACHEIDHDTENFTADEQGSLMKRAMGHSMLRKDDPEHADDRRGYGNVLKPKAIKSIWTGIFQENTDHYLKHYRSLGPGADLHTEFAAPLAAENLRAILGFENITQEDLQRWSQALIDGTGNYADDPEVWARSERAYDEVDAAIDEMLPRLKANPNHTLLSQVLEYGMPMTNVRANLKMTIGGGLNEPRDVIGTLAWALLSNPEQAEAVRRDKSLWLPAFDEAVRWVAPIGMYSRQVVKDVELQGVHLKAGSRLGVNVGAANRDPGQFEDPESFNIFREKLPHLGFGSGIHFCAGAWIAKAMVAQIAVPQLFREFDGLALDPANEAVEGGWVFRGMLSLPLIWNT